MPPGPVPCPLCGELVQPGSRECGGCGLIVTDEALANVQALVDALKVDKGTAQRLSESGFKPAEPAKQHARESTLSLCPSCGSFVRSKDTACATCGVRLDEDAAKGASKPRPGFCPVCGSNVVQGALACTSCGAALPTSGAFRPREPKAPLPDIQGPSERVEPTAPSTPGPIPAKSDPDPHPESDGSRPGRRRAPWKALSSGEPTSGEVGHPTTGERLASLREYVALGTAIALPAAGGASLGRIAGREWGELILFGVLFGIGLVLTLPEMHSRRAGPGAFPLAVLGFAIIGGGPLFTLVNASILPFFSLLGLAALGYPAWRLRRDLGIHLAWLGGLLVLIGLAITRIASSSQGGVAGEVLWLLGAGLAFGASLLVTARRVLLSAATARLSRGHREYARREYEKAIAAYEAALRLARRAGQEAIAGWYGKGAALVALGRHSEAVEALDRALVLDPANEIAWINKGTALARIGQLTDALRCFNSAIKVNPSYEVAWNNKGNALSRIGREEMALGCYERAIEIDPSYRTAWVNKGYVLARLGRFEEAARCAETAVQLTPSPS